MIDQTEHRFTGSHTFMNPSIPRSLMPHGSRSADGIVSEALHSIRTLLDMEVVFVSEFSLGKRIFRYVECCGDVAPVQVGDADPVEETYCQRVIDGRLPEIIKRTDLNQEACSLPITSKLGIGCYLSVPIRFSDGSLYDTLCRGNREQDRRRGGKTESELQALRDLRVNKAQGYLLGRPNPLVSH